MRNTLKNKLIQELGNDYIAEIDYMLDNIINYYKENYFLHLKMVKQLKKRNDLEAQIAEEHIEEFTKTNRGSVKKHPIFIELARVEKEIERLSKSLNKTKKKKEDESDDYFIDFNTADEIELALELQFGILQWNYHAMSLNIEPEEMNLDQIANQDYYIKHLQRNPLFDSNNLNWWHYQNVIDKIMEKNR